jgi:acyl-CoA reductase-like NAD-dependent aldehyde dehydrogenase
MLMTTATVTGPVCGNFINGRWVESYSGKGMERGNPADPREVTSVAPLSTREEVRDAIAAAKIAFPGCRNMPARIETGITHVNAPIVASEAQMPFGGTKGTAVGLRETGRVAIDFDTELKAVYIDYTSRPA